MEADIPEGRMKCALRNSSEQRGAFAAEGKKAGAPTMKILYFRF
jgi:hypothetical protein